jgi:ElaB/YqjD/DUF883 family membrane-anchored ribosome-binding protein
MTMAVGQTTNTAADAKDAPNGFEAEIAHLRSEVIALAKSVGDLGRASGAGIADQAQHLSDDLTADARRAAQDIGQRLSAAEKPLEDSLRDHPLTWFLGALGIGAFLALLLRRPG